MPNILLILFVLVNLFFMGNYILDHSWGMFFSITGIIFLVLGVIIFIFFLSIDPGYGWIRSINFTKNYIMIFTSMAVSIAGIVLIITGQQLNELHEQKISKEKRCRDLIAGKAPEVLKQDWYSLQDLESHDQLNLYLFQKKSNRNNYKIIATFSNLSTFRSITHLTVLTESVQESLHVAGIDSSCPGVYEKNISIDFDKHQQLGSQVNFNLSVTIAEHADNDTEDGYREKTVQFTLQSTNAESDDMLEPCTQLGTQPLENNLVCELF